MNLNDLMLNSGGGEMNGDMDSMDVALNYVNPDIMSSEFFDSVLSLENNLDDGFFPGFDDDLPLSSDTSSHTDEVLSPESYFSESSGSENVDETASGLTGFENCDVLMSLLDQVPNVQLETTENLTTITQAKPMGKPTKILIQNPNNKKIISKPLIPLHTSMFTQLKKNLKVKPQILKVQSVSNTGRPVLLPLSVKSIKILNSNAELSSITGNFKRRKIATVQSSEDDDDSTVVSSSDNQYPPLVLTNEEKRLLAKEGIQLPAHHPLTKNEERELKRIRRKIRNKISAQDSRKRKKEYVDGLEERVKRGSEENKNLLQRVRELQRQNKTLLAHVAKLQALMRKSTTTKTTPSTCLMVILLSALLVSMPNIRLFESKQMANEQEQVAVGRSLLSSQPEDDALNMEEFLVFKDDEPEFDAKFGDDVSDIENSTTDKEFSKLVEEMGKKYHGHVSDKNSSDMFSKVVESLKHYLDKGKTGELFDYGGYHNKRGFIEPDIDDDPGEIPMKRTKYTEVDAMEENEFNPGGTNGKIVSATVNTNKFGIKNSKVK